ncbi:MAG: NDP-hexose 4-ketoreductase, partial [Solirubrobacteraceae bacterium]
VEKGWDPSMGARPLRRAIQRYIEDPLADFVLRAELMPGGTVVVDRAPEGSDPEVTLDVVAPKVPAGVGAREETQAEDDAPEAPEAAAPPAEPAES